MAGRTLTALLAVTLFTTTSASAQQAGTYSGTSAEQVTILFIAQTAYILTKQPAAALPPVAPGTAVVLRQRFDQPK